MKTVLALCLVLLLAGCRKSETPRTPVVPAAVTNSEAASEGGAVPARPGYYVPPDLKTKFMLYNKSQMLEVLVSGDNHTNLAEHDDLLSPFQMKSFHNGQVNDVQLIGQAPECHVDTADHRAWDAGPVVLFTPTSNVWVRGEGFLFVETNHQLIVSNKVETRVLRSLLATTGPGSARTNAAAANGQILKIFSDWCVFDYESNFARYFGHVHVVDVQLDVKSQRLSIQMTTNSAIQTILAEDDVVLTTTNNGWAAGPRAYYYVTNGSQMTEMTGGAVWHNGGQKAQAETFLYDNNRHFLTANRAVHVWWPNAAARPGAPPNAGQGGIRELSADFATLQWPPTNGPVEAMHAAGRVLIVNHGGQNAGESRAAGDMADYTRASGLFVLSGNPKWWNDKMEIRGQTLTAEASNQVYHARNGADLKLKVGGAAHSDEWLDIASEQLDYHTNLALFTGRVKARLLDGGVLRDTLTSDKLDVEMFSNEVKTAVARGHVQGETAPDTAGRVKTLACDTLTARRDPVKKLLTEILAENHVALQQFAANPSEPHNELTAKTVTAYFSSVLSNRLERAVAERGVVIDQVKSNRTIHATGERGVYTAAQDQCVLTGAPAIRSDRNLLTGADSVMWQTRTNRFQAYGPYTIAPIKTPANSAARNP
ncbi:MAG TPA: LptA/OstA family protein [Verrucomicrobiae bacterium]|jgi:lipopolysaccharide export system protein LptA